MSFQTSIMSICSPLDSFGGSPQRGQKVAPSSLDLWRCRSDDVLASKTKRRHMNCPTKARKTPETLQED